MGTDHNGMGSTFGDYDGDGDLDWFITNITAAPDVPSGFGGWNRLYRNDGNRTFTDVTEEAGVRDSRWSWGTSFLDYDNDGDLDLIATNGYNGAGWADDQTYLWRNDNGVFTDVSTSAGITDAGQGRGLAHLDYDNDGDLDVVIVNNAAQPILYRNDGGNAQSFLRIDPIGTESNRDGVGAFLTVTPDLSAPQRRLVWEIDGGSSFLSQNEQIAHFGLGPNADAVDLVTIQWPSGIVQHLRRVGANQTLTVVETADQAVIGDIDFSGSWEAADVDWMRLAIDQPQLYESLFGISAGNVADLNQDGEVDALDVDELLNSIVGAEYGDLNLDGSVDSSDAALWGAGFGILAGARYADGDVDGDGSSNGADFLALQQRLAATPQLISAAREAPEPSSLFLAWAAVCGAMGSRRRGRCWPPQNSVA